MFRKWSVVALDLVFASATLLNLTGCNKFADDSSHGHLPGTAEKKIPDAPADHSNAEHGHKTGKNGGIIVPLGTDSYHAEAIFEKGGLLKLFTLGKDEGQINDVDSQTLKAYVKEEAGADAVEMELSPVPRSGDKPGRTSQFIGKLPAELVGKQLTVTIPIIAIDGERFRIGFASTLPKHDEDMPIGLNVINENELYLKPGGIYTEADIKANGNMTATQKFKGLVSKHDMKPKPGEKICPITLTKANPQFTWVVGGKTYEFCCPPCVDEFVKTARESPEDIKEPEAYVKKK